MSASAVRIPASTHLLFSAGSVPGIAASNNDTLELTGAKGAAEEVSAPENIFELAAICACTSSPTTLR